MILGKIERKGFQFIKVWSLHQLSNSNSKHLRKKNYLHNWLIYKIMVVANLISVDTLCVHYQVNDHFFIL
jgi:hypothetical protein